MEIKKLDFTKLEIPLNKLFARLGYLSGKTELDKKLRTEIEEELILARKLFNPKYVIAESVILFGANNEVLLEPGLKILSNDIRRLLHGCIKALGFAVTIGPALEIKRDDYANEKNTAKALLLDAIGSVAAEEMAETINKMLKEEAAKENLNLTRRFSPGYGDWDIKNQTEFLKWLGADKIGIKLTSQMQMLPEKSISALIGIRNG